MASNDNTVKAVQISGAGDYFCSGNDLSNFMEATKPNADVAKVAEQAKTVLKRFVATFIDFPKPIIGLINGPAIGIAVTTLPLYDSILASDAATFNVPLTVLGQYPEGCSSFTFPRVMGTVRANDVLLFGRKLTAQEALSIGLINDVFPMNSFDKETRARVEKIVALPPQALLHEVNVTEADRLAERWTAPECIQAVTNFIQSK